MKEQISSSKPPFFIVGCPRSGTTLLQILIDAHPNIAIPPESFIFQRFADIFGFYGNLADDPNLRAFAGDLLADERIVDWKLNVSEGDFVARAQTRTVAGMISLLFETYAQQHGKTRWGDKTPQHALYLKEIVKVFPEARFIHLVRDGRDVAESFRRIYIGPKSIYAIAKRWKQFTAAFADFKMSLPEAQYLEIRYEDLVADPPAQQKKIFDFLDEPSDQGIVSGKELPDTEARQQAVGAASHHESLTRSISESKTGIYRKVFSAREIEIFEWVAGDMLSVYGYPANTSNPKPPSTTERIRFLVTDTVYRYFRKLFRPQMLKHLDKELRLEMQLRTRRALRRKHAAV